MKEESSEVSEVQIDESYQQLQKLTLQLCLSTFPLLQKLLKVIPAQKDLKEIVGFKARAKSSKNSVSECKVFRIVPQSNHLCCDRISRYIPNGKPLKTLFRALHKGAPGTLKMFCRSEEQNEKENHNR